ncbi:uncharacterized protein LOC124819958 [Vigna umbellata]|uniref:uncharacterized protein LOC124819958 n=1 Tax=Vigna umbellata TaxID=87088 RepID=UPI001F5F4861|nr:uncharacterized protein LOC124819958 [Vigna umbellata]
MDEEWQCRKFENGLRGDIKLLVAGLCIKEFLALVERARVMEKTKKDVKSQHSQPFRVGGSLVSRRSFKSRRTPYFMPHSHGSRGSSSQSFIHLGQSSYSGSVRCYICGGSHPQSALSQMIRYKRCNICRREGHYARDCPIVRRTSSQSHHVGRSQAYALSGTEAASSRHPRCVLDATVVEGRQFRVNLICLPLQGLEVILGMDLISVNRILIDCGEKKLLFPEVEELVLLSSGQVRQELMDGSCCFLGLSHLEVVQSERGLNHSIVSDFLDEFPEKVPRLPPQREVEFSIDLVPSARPVSIVPYRMALAKLVELKKQIEELLKK